MNARSEPAAAPLRVSGLVKRFGAREVIAGVDLALERGEALGLAGVNGAGKTTLIKCVLDLCAHDRGSIEIYGRSSREARARSRLAYLPEQFVPPHYLRGAEFLRTTLALSGVAFDPSRARTLCEELELEAEALERPVRQLSKGMSQKLGLVACFLAERDLLVLDEPMSGLDPASRVAVKSALRRVVARGGTLLLTSHLLADLDELCAAIAVLDRGRIRFRGAPDEMRARYEAPDLEHAFLRCVREAP